MVVSQKNYISYVTCSKNNQISVTILVFVIVVLCSECGLVESCGDVGSGGILDERDRLESPEANYVNVRSRRATSNDGERKACGKDNTEKIPLIRYSSKCTE